MITIQILGKFYNLSLKIQFHFQFDIFFTTWQIIFSLAYKKKYIFWFIELSFSEILSISVQFNYKEYTVGWITETMHAVENFSLLEYPFKVFDDMFFHFFLIYLHGLVVKIL